MTTLPAFYYRRAVADDGAVLDEGDGFVVFRRNGVVALDCLKLWEPEFEEIYRRHDAQGVCINTFSRPSWEGRSLDFLSRLPGLRFLSLNVHFPMDLTTLGKLDGLESLTLGWNVPGPPGAIDFTRLVRLEECHLSWHPAFATILDLGSLRILSLHDAARLKELDLTGLPRLAELGLMSFPALTRIDFGERPELIALELTNCGKFRPDWARLAPDLRYLCVRGRIGFAVEEIAEADGLQFLWAELSSKQSSWEFLRDLPRLEGVWLLDLKIAKPVADLVRSINLSHGHGPTLAVKPRRLDLTS